MKKFEFPYNELDYLTLLELFKIYRRPRDKITDLLRQKVLVRIKKGLYILGPEWSKGPFSPEILANQIYGPSCISLEYALAYYGMIPERVNVITSVTPNRNKIFQTPAGTFTYQAVSLEYYSAGIDRVELSDGRGFLIASPEKALADRIYREKTFRSIEELDRFLEENLRMERSDLKRLDRAILERIRLKTGKKNIGFLLELRGRV